ncbi:Protein PNS1 [Dictyocoela muelleri]|nr:Protein PNS1 [Dictyocoela muelleri]
MTNQPILQSRKRKFNDPIPFILYIIFTLTLTGYLTMTFKIRDIMLDNLPLSFLATAMLSVIISMGLMTIIFLFAPKFALHASFFIMPTFFVIVTVLSGDAIGAVFAIISAAINLYLYFFVYKKRIKYTAAVLKVSTKIIMPYLAFLTAIAAVFIAYALGLGLLVSGALENSKKEQIIIPIGFLYFYWNFFNMLYTFRVFCSSIVATQVLSIADVGLISTLSISFTNTLLCLGSISLAGFIMAVVLTMKAMINQNRKKSERQSIFSEILRFIAILILSIIEDILNFANEWVFVFMAIYGESYAKSMKNAYNLLISGENKILIDSLAMLPLLELLGFSCFIIYFVLCAPFVPNIDSPDNKSILPIMILTIFYLYMVNYFIIIFDSAGKAFLFSYNQDKAAVRNKYPETYEVLEDLKAQ